MRRVPRLQRGVLPQLWACENPVVHLAGSHRVRHRDVEYHLHAAVHVNILAFWSAEEWGKFLGYFGDFIVKVAVALTPLIAYLIGKAKGVSDQHTDQIKTLDAKVNATALAVDPVGPKITPEMLAKAYADNAAAEPITPEGTETPA
jgi:hypothetical protein